MTSTAPSIPRTGRRVPHSKSDQPAECESFRECKPCNTCGSVAREVVYHWPANYYPHDRYATDSWDGAQSVELQVVKCRDCDLVYSYPSFRESALGTVYSQEVVSLDFERNPADLLDAAKWAEMIACVKRHLAPGSVVCDIGTRYGALVNALNRENYQGMGTEYNAASVELARKLGVPNVFQGMVTDLPDICAEHGIDRINGVLMDDVLEHLVDPKRDLQILRSFQQAGDVLVLRQMDYASWGRKIFGRDWYYFQPAAHMYYFSEPTVRDLLNRLGYDVLEVHRTPWYSQLRELARVGLRWAVVRTPVLRHLYLKYRHHVGRGRTRPHYTAQRSHLHDMFMIVARKRGE